MDAPRDNLPGPAAPPAAAYGRRCGYPLHGLPSGKCPECGGAFDLADRKTFARRPPRPALRRWARRAALSVALLALAAASVPGWYWWEWRTEQRSLDTIRALGGRVTVRQVEADGLARYFPERWPFLRNRASEVKVLSDLTAEQARRLDLRPLARLDYLDLRGACYVNDPMLAQLRGLVDLRVLNLDRSPLDGSGLPHLAGCRRLEFLSLNGTRLTDAGLAHLGRMTSLRRLWLRGTAVTDAGLAHLAALTSLDFLDLSGTEVTDAGLVHLHGLTSLHTVWLACPEITKQGKRDLWKALPNAWIPD